MQRHFWNTWRVKFSKPKNSAVIDGCCNEQDIANNFADVFKSVCVPNCYAHHKQLHDEFTSRYSKMDNLYNLSYPR